MLSLYDASVPSMIGYLGSLKNILRKGEDFCKARGSSPDYLLGTRMHCTMFPLIFQVQMCSNTAKLLVLRVGGVESEKLEDNESSFEQLYSRLDKTMKILKSVKPDSMNGDDARLIHVKTPLTSFTLSAADYVTQYAVPNFHFHLTTAYNILRSQGVEIGKLDYACFETDPSGRLKD